MPAPFLFLSLARIALGRALLRRSPGPKVQWTFGFFPAHPVEFKMYYSV